MIVNKQWLIPVSVGTTFMLSSPALAADLESWRFDANRNVLEINTRGGVQPKAQLVFNPSRLVIDLPGVRFGRPQETQAVRGGAGINSIRVGQFDAQTTRMVIELASGYTLDPNQIKFEGKSDNRWTVQLPTPQVQQVSSVPRNSAPRNIYNVVIPEGQTAPPRTIPPRTTTPERSTVLSSTDITSQLEGFRVTGDGFFIRTTGGNPRIRVNRSNDRGTIFFDITGAILAPNFGDRDVTLNNFGVSRVEINPLQTNPPSVRMTLRVDRNSPDWRPLVNNESIIFLPNRLTALPSRGNNPNPDPDNNPRPPFPRPDSPVSSIPSSPSTVQSIELANGGTQLIIRGDQNLSANAGWDRSTMNYRIVVNNARLANSLPRLPLDANSPVLRVRLQQQDNSVVILIQPAAGVQIGELNQFGRQTLALQLQRVRTAITPPLPPGYSPRAGLPPLPFPNQPGSPQPLPPGGINPYPNPDFPSRPTPNGRRVVVIDPGHGAQDPGAIGIGGLQEKDVILPIGVRVAQILQQNGVQVIMTRNSDFFVSLQGRVDIAQRANADAFVSIHANSLGLGRPDVNGLENYYNTPQSLGLARAVHNSILQTVPVRDRGVRRARFYVVRKTTMPSILVETGYVTGAEDAARLRTREHQNAMAEAIARGILSFLQGR
jgi:N-acetylmuramoyl-L-alanine amidase